MLGHMIMWGNEIPLGVQEYELVSDTLFLAISYIDRFLTVRQIERSRLQLVGVACLLIAAKYEEIYAPQVLTQSLLLIVVSLTCRKAEPCSLHLMLLTVLQHVGMQACYLSNRAGLIICVSLLQVDELCFITENTYTRQEIIAMETDVLDGLKFECTTPTVKVFLRRFCVAAGDVVSQQR